MANDFPVTPGAGRLVATDEVSGRDYQLVKLVNAAEDSETRILTPVAAADNMANPTVPQILAHLVAFDGATWDRVKLSGGGRLITSPVGLFTAIDGLPNTIAYFQSEGNDVARVSGSGGHLFNGSTWDRERGNVNAQLLASAARTATTTSPDQINHNGRGVVLLLDVTANPGGIETLTVSIEAKLGGDYRAITAFAAAAAATNATYVYQLYPGIVETSAVGNVEVQGLVLPRDWRAVVTHSSTGSWTYALESSLLV